MNYQYFYIGLQTLAGVFSKFNFGELADELYAIATLNTSLSFDEYMRRSEHILYDYKDVLEIFPEEHDKIKKIFDYLLKEYIKQYNVQLFINARADNQSP